MQWMHMSVECCVLCVVCVYVCVCTRACVCMIHFLLPKQNSFDLRDQSWLEGLGWGEKPRKNKALSYIRVCVHVCGHKSASTQLIKGTNFQPMTETFIKSSVIRAHHILPAYLVCTLLKPFIEV